MAISEKENILRFYHHERPEHLPNMDYLHTVHPAKGYLERPDEGNQEPLTDWFGVKYVREPIGNAAMPDTIHNPTMTDVTEWRDKVHFPDLDNMDWEEAARKDGMDKIDREHKAVSCLVQTGIYERFHSFMGIENAMISIMEEPEESQALLDAITDYKVKLAEKIIEYYKPDIFRHHDDYGTQIAMQMNPNLWREMIKPNIKRIVDVCHAHGVAYEQHSCGLIEPIIPDFVEIGVDSWQGMHINDVPKLQKETKGKLLYHMSLNTQKYIAEDMSGNLTEEQLRRDVRDTVTACAEDGTYFPVITINNGAWRGDSIIYDELMKLRDEIEIRYPW